MPGDRFLRPIVRRLIRGQPRLGGVEKVFANLCLGLDRLQIEYEVNLPFKDLDTGDRVGVLGRGRYSLQGYDRSNPIVAGIGLMTHPSEWPSLCEDYPVVKYLQHSEWANNVYKPYFGERCGIWPVGIDTQLWTESAKTKDFDFLIYDKIYWDRAVMERTLVTPILESLVTRGLTFNRLAYGSYDPQEYLELLQRSRAMLFLSAHESQGIACQECLSSNVPVLAWDQGWFLDPNRFTWGEPKIPATSVPYFDGRCGETFRGIEDFDSQLDKFLTRQRNSEMRPREYILENLTLEKAARDYLEILADSATT
jgi:hypothetical protein